jgi:uncharacterized membrane protein YfcA
VEESEMPDVDILLMSIILYLVLGACLVLLGWNLVRRAKGRRPVGLGRPLHKESRRVQCAVIAVSIVVGVTAAWFWTDGTWVFLPLAAELTYCGVHALILSYKGKKKLDASTAAG